MKTVRIPCLLAAIILTIAACASGPSSDLERGFVRPPDSARPWVYWFWLAGNINREAITADLEAMKRVGIGGVLILEVDQGAPHGPIQYASREWHDLFQFTLAEANRLGLEVNMNNDAGWCGSGGPWITPELSQKKIVWTETLVAGGGRFEGKLARPQTVVDWYRDIAVLAFPTPAGDDLSLAAASPKVTAPAAGRGFDAKALLDGDPGTRVVLPLPGTDKPQTIDFELDRPYLARSLTFSFSGPEEAGVHGALQISDDGKSFKTVIDFDAAPPGLSEVFEGVQSRHFRILFTRADPLLESLPIADIDISPRFRIREIQAKAAFVPRHTPLLPQQSEPGPALTIPREGVVDLTGRLGPEGEFAWDAPEGKWTLLRIGYTPTGKTNHPAPVEGRGLECDKLDKRGAEAMFEGLMAKLVAGSKSLVPKTLVSTHIDSWEIGSQNWTEDFREEFRRRRGYDPLVFLPALTGRVVETLEVTERFLWDFRQTISDMIVENYAGRFRTLANGQGLRLSIEAYDAPADEMTYAGQADEPMAEFWAWRKYPGAAWCAEMASAAHTYGKKIVGVEAFTANDTERWQGHPAVVKDLGDWGFCEGINRFVIHRYALQPWTINAPGMSMGPWGLHYERTQTWWEMSKAWHEYLARCQFLLQQGLIVADVCCLNQEGLPMRFTPPTSLMQSALDRGPYNFDGCTAEVLLTRMTVKDGRLVLPDGMSYRILVLPETETMTPELLRRVRDLVKAGATIVGSRPVKSPSLAGYPDCDGEIKSLADEIWGDGVGAAEHSLGSGRVISGKTPAEVLAGMGIGPDFQYSASAGIGLRYTHRTIDGAEVYFVANKNDRSGEAVCSFRVRGSRPELWWPDTGRIDRTAAYDEADGYVRVPIRFDPVGSVFVVFRRGNGIEPDRITSWTRNGAAPVVGAVSPEPIPEDNNAGVVGTFTMAVWAKPDVDVPLPEEINAGMNPGSRRNDAVYPAPGNELYPSEAGHAGAGFSIGQNGVCVYEQGAFYFVPILVRAVPVNGWTHVAIVYKDGQPELYLNGKFVYRGLKSAFKVHPAAGVRHGRGTQPFKGELSEIRQFGRALTEAELSDLMKTTPLPAPAPQTAVVDIVRGKSGRAQAEVGQPGLYEFRTADGRKHEFDANALPGPLEISGPWSLSFPARLGAPESVTLAKLVSWSEHEDPGVKYFSGRATYGKSFDVPADLIRSDRRLYLDLGKVAVMAEVTLNGRPLGVLWKAPFRVDVTETVKAGANVLEIVVANLWINRQIGDEQLAEDSDRNPDGTLKAWPQWLLEGRPSPTGRIAFNSWRLLEKNDPLVESGLLGPVTLRSAARLELD